MKKLLITCLFLALFPAFTQTKNLADYSINHATPAISWDGDNIFDRSFNELSYKGAQRYVKKTGIQYDSLKGNDTRDYVKNLTRFAVRGADPIIIIGDGQTAALQKVAAKFPDSHFVVVSGFVEAPNVSAITFKTEESSFLVGMLAAMKSKTGKVGFIGGTFDNADIRRFLCGYRQGVRYANPDVTVIADQVSTPSGEFNIWNSPERGGQLAKKQIKQGADVIFAVAGGTGKGIYIAAKEAGVYAIGVDSNQNYMHPGTMLTSAMKNLDVVVEESLGQHGEEFVPGTKLLGLAEGAVGWALDEHNRELITPEMEAKVDEVSKKIVSGDMTIRPICTKPKAEKTQPKPQPKQAQPEKSNTEASA